MRWTASGPRCSKRCFPWCVSEMARLSPWGRFVESAVRGRETPAASANPASSAACAPRVVPAPGRPRDQPGTKAAGAEPVGREVRRLGARVGTKLWGKERGNPAFEAPRRRTDVRLALPALLVWGAAVAGVWLTPGVLGPLCCSLLLLAAFLLARAARGRNPAAGRRSFLTTTAVALALAAAAAAHSAVSASQRHDGPLADAVAAGKSVVAVLKVAGSPRALAPAGRAGMPGRWSVAATSVEITVGGHVIRASAPLVVVGGDDWGQLVPGQTVRTAGKLKSPDAGQIEAGVLAAASAPVILSDANGWETGAEELRSSYVAAASFLAPDARGLLPGMVTGDTSALDEGLTAAMKTVGMTHLTAVSGASTRTPRHQS